MLVDGRTYKVLKIEDLNSDISFGEWLVRNLSLYDNREEIPKQHIEIYLKRYIVPRLTEVNGDTRSLWRAEIEGILGEGNLK
jgi:hypothetical protein